MGKRWLGLLALCILFVLFSFVTVFSLEYVEMCINHPPYSEITSCSDLNITWGDTFYCAINFTDPDSGDVLVGHSIVLNASNDSQILPLNMSVTTVNNSAFINYTTTLDDWGTDYVLIFGVDDQSNCTNNVHDFWLYFNITGNRPPIQIQNLSNVNFVQGMSIIPFDLDNYFYDPDGDEITYTILTTHQIDIEILASNQVYFDSDDFCGTEILTFNATDEYNLSIASNNVTVSVQCAPDQSTQSGSSSGGGGGSSSASGKSTVVDQTGYNRKCIPDYFCTQWSRCLPIGKQTRECVDIRSCDMREKRRVEVRDCVYVPTCNDGIKNGFEEEIDCGGPDCISCEQISCSDGLMNGKETGIDCGGPDCSACATCFDNIRNRDEQGIDCGGTYCQRCDNIIVSDILPKNDYFTRILMGVLLGVVIVLTLMKFFYGYIDWFLTKFMFLFSRKKRRIVVAADVKEEMLKRLAVLEKSIETTPVAQLSVEFSQLVRYFFKQVFALPFEFTYNELLEKLKEARIDELLKKVLLLFFKRSLSIEFSGYVLTKGEITALIDEFRELVLQTAVLTLKDVKAMHKEIHYHEIPQEVPLVDRIYLEISNSQLSLKHGAFVDAVSGYKAALGEYEHIGGAKKSEIYPDINRLYLEILLRDKRSIL